MDTTGPVFFAIQKAIADAAPGAKTAELHLQLIKHSGELKKIHSETICEGIGINKSFRSVVLNMLKISDRLKLAGLDVTHL